VEKLAYRIPEVSEETGLSPADIYRAIRDGELVARKRGRATLVLRDDLVAFLSALERKAPIAATA
jgi:excisionase family DNA binding protein